MFNVLQLASSYFLFRLILHVEEGQKEVMEQGSAVKANATTTRRKPAWMNEPGAPPQPDFAQYAKVLNEIFNEKNALLVELKALQESVTVSSEETKMKNQCEVLRSQLNEIDIQRKNEQTLRSKKNEEITDLRKRRRQNSDKQQSVQVELGGFASVKEIDAAIVYMRRKMEMTGGGLDSEKKINRRLHQLEEAKGLLVQLQGLSDSVQRDQEREVTLEQEFRDIHERIAGLNKQYQEKMQKKRELDSIRAELHSSRTAVYKKSDEFRAQIKNLLNEINKKKKEREEKKDAWDAWCKSSKAKYFAKLEAERQSKKEEEREKRKSMKLEGKRARALKRQNPFTAEIATCDILLQYLKEKEQLLAHQEEELAKSVAAKNFDPIAAAPEGFVVISQPVRTTVSKGNISLAKKENIRHSEDKTALFQTIGLRPPAMRKFISSSVEEIEKKKLFYQSHTIIGELVLSSDDEATDSDVSEKEKSPCENDSEVNKNESEENCKEQEKTDASDEDDLSDTDSKTNTP